MSRIKKARKPRGLKQDGTMSSDMCTGCIAFNCDPMAMSNKFQAMVRDRHSKGQCVSCGASKEKCICKSTLSLPKRELGEGTKLKIAEIKEKARLALREKMLKRLEEKKLKEAKAEEDAKGV